MELLTHGNVALQEIAKAMQSIGYREDLDLLRWDYAYTNTVVRHQDVHKIDLAGFAQSPPTYRNVCIGVVVSNGASGTEIVAEHRTLGAPLVFEISGTVINRWKVTASGDPEFKEGIPFGDIVNAFDQHRKEWEPESILRAKAIGDVRGPVQLDFYDEDYMPFLEGSNFSKVDYLLHNVLTEINRIYKHLGQRTPRFQNLFRLTFRFIAAKVFRDRGHLGGWQSNDARTALNAIEAYYGDALPPSAAHSTKVLNEIWKIFLTSFIYPNLSEDDLALFFEKSFITPETRDDLGIHSTPPRVVEYIVHKLPFEALPEDDRYVVEPFAGHGRFLVSSMRRMRDLLSSPISDAERHDYFVQRLVGIELDEFSIEVCRLSLMLADYPNKNSWRIYAENVFATDTLQKELKSARILLSNPPFEAIPIKDRGRYNNPDLLIQKPAELLRRTLSQPPELLGLVLPHIFKYGRSYRKFHQQLAENYGSIELIALPEVFNYSEAETMLVLASERRRNNRQVFVTCRTVTKQDRDLFLKTGFEPPAVTDNKVLPLRTNGHFSLWIPRLARVWAYLQTNPMLREVAVIHRGLHWKANVNAVSEVEKPGYMKGVALVEGHLMQYVLEGYKYLSRRKEHQHDTAYKFEWEKPKVVCNRTRLRRKGWRVGAVADPKGLIFSDRFLALWPLESISIYALAALLNSPMASAYVFAKDGERDNRVPTLNSLPIPPQEFLTIGSSLDLLSQRLHRMIRKEQAEAKKLLIQIDAEVLRAYDLPPFLERELLDTFQGVERPVPFEFSGYYPKDFAAYYPLHEIISEEFELARADRLMERLPMIEDKDLGEYLDYLYEESTDEQRLPE